MSRYIDADKARIKYSSEDVDDVASLFNELLDAQPTADVVEVVRCKDCKKENTDSCPFFTCILSNAWSDEYCSRGERTEA